MSIDEKALDVAFNSIRSRFVTWDSICEFTKAYESAKSPEQPVVDEAAEAREILAKGDFLGVEESERFVSEVLEQPVDSATLAEDCLMRFDFDPDFSEGLKQWYKMAQHILDYLQPYLCKRESSWQPIETAPKVGNVILVSTPGATPHVVRWSDNKGGQWFVCDVPGFWVEEPTHWMPVSEIEGDN